MSKGGAAESRLHHVLAVGVALPPTTVSIDAKKGGQLYQNLKSSINSPSGIAEFNPGDESYSVWMLLHITQLSPPKRPVFHVSLARPTDLTRMHPGLFAYTDDGGHSIFEKVWQVDQPSPNPMLRLKKTGDFPTTVTVKLPEELRVELQQALLSMPVNVVTAGEMPDDGKMLEATATVVEGGLTIPDTLQFSTPRLGGVFDGSGLVSLF